MSRDVPHQSVQVDHMDTIFGSFDTQLALCRLILTDTLDRAPMPTLAQAMSWRAG